jgi:hypothetical protein
MQLTANKLTQSVVLLASSVYEGARLHFSSVLSSLAVDISLGRLIPVALLTYAVYDETPMTAATSTTTDKTSSHHQVLAALTKGKAPRETEVCKIEQCETTFAFVVRRPGSKRCTFVATELACPLQNGDRTTGEVSRAHLSFYKSLNLWESLKAKFPMALEMSTRDRGSGNLRAERSLITDDPLGVYFGQWCIIHCLHNVVGRLLASIAPTVSGAIAFALAQKPVGEAIAWQGSASCRQAIFFNVSGGQVRCWFFRRFSSVRPLTPRPCKARGEGPRTGQASWPLRAPMLDSNSVNLWGVLVP